MELVQLLEHALGDGATEVFFFAGAPPSYRKGNRVLPVQEKSLMPEEVEELIDALYLYTELKGKDGEILREARSQKNLNESGDDRFSFFMPGMGRLQVNAFHQRGSLSAVVHTAKKEIPKWESFGIPSVVMDLTDSAVRGMILFTGPAESEKSTTMACVTEQINKTRNIHIATIESPIEFIHRHNKSLVSQMEVKSDTRDYISALDATLAQKPDVLVVDKMQSSKAIETLLNAAEEGRLVLSTLHTIGAVATLEHILNKFPEHHQNQIRFQLSMSLRAVVSQQLLPTKDGGRVAAFEIMILNLAIRNMIRENKVHMIENNIRAGKALGMRLMDDSILDLVKEGKVDKDVARQYCVNLEEMNKKLEMMR